MDIPSRVDQTIRLPRKVNDCHFLCIHILKHVDNFKNNSDKFLVIINGPLQQVTISNNKCDVLDEPHDEQELAFEVIGAIEIWELFDWSNGKTYKNKNY